MSAVEWKARGNEAFKAKSFDEAVECFTKAIEVDPNDHVLYSNRSGAYASLEKYSQALSDAERCVALNPGWAKGWSRKGCAELGLNKHLEAIQSYTKGLELEPGNTACQEGLNNARVAGSSFIRQDQLQLQVLLSLGEDPKFQKYIEEDPEYIQKVAGLAGEVAISGNVQKLQMALAMSGDHRVKEGLCKVFKIDLPEEQAKPEVQKKEEEKMEEPKDTKNTEAEEVKRQGNEAYKKRNFDEAEALYQQAFDLDPTEILYLNNLAAVYLERGEYEKCLATCDKAIAIRYETCSDYSKVAKVLNRKAACYMKMGCYEKAIQEFKSSLTEDNNRQTRAALREAERLFEKQKADAFIDPVKAEEHKVKGNEYFKEKNYPDAKREYDLAIKRDPANAKLYSNRAAAYMQLLEYPSALKDAEKAIELDPTFAKAWARKGACHLKLKEAHKALEAYQKGRELDPSSDECARGLAETFTYIRTTQSSTDVDPEQFNRAMADPEIQAILGDPQFRLILEGLQSDPSRLPEYLRDEKIAKGINKLMAAGVIRTA